MTITPMIPTPPFLEFISISYPSAMAAVQPHCDASLGVPTSNRQPEAGLWLLIGQAIAQGIRQPRPCHAAPHGARSLAWSLPPELAWLLPTEGADGVAKGREGEHSSASELLADWRSAERDSVAAHEAASVAARAVTSAAAAEEAAVEAESAAREARDAAVRAKEAADRAKTLATQASEAAQLAAVRTEDEQSQADQTVVAADDAESEARDRFHSAQKDGFPKDRP